MRFDEVLTEYTYSYDENGNITTIEGTETTDTEEGISRLSSAEMTYDEENRLLTYNGKAIRYDADGNMTYGPVNGDMSEMLYDCRNRLVEAGDIRYEYDAENNRIAMENGEYREEYVTDTVSSSLSRVLMSTRYRLENDKAEEPMLYIYGSGLIYEYSGDIYLYHHYNNLGSTMKLTDDFGDVVAYYTYGVYGELLSGDTGLTRFLYNGRCGVTTDDNGLYYMRQRYYNPEIKRFVNQDILTGSMGNSQSLNRYSYVQGNPVSYTDPFGLSPLGGLFTGTGLAHGVLGMLGCLPGIPGAIFNGIDAWVYATIDKDYFMATMAGLSAVSLGIGGIAKWAGKAATAGTKGAKAFGYMSTIGSCMSNGIEFAQNGMQTAVAAYDAWNTYTQTGSADAGSVAGVGLSALATIWSGANLSKSSKEFGKMLKADGVTSKIRQKVANQTDRRGSTLRGILSDRLGVEVENVSGLFYSMKNKQGGEVYVSTDMISSNDFANIVGNANGITKVNIISGIHGDDLGRVAEDISLYFDDIRDFQNPNVNVYNYMEMDFDELSDVINSTDLTICAWCYSECNPVVRMALQLGRK